MGIHWFDPQHLSWWLVLGPATLLAAAIILDNRYLGPYFAVLDVVFNDFGTGYKWSDREILLSLARRYFYTVFLGVVLRVFNYGTWDIGGVFLVAGFLLIWPAFGRGIPVYARTSDWQVLLTWALYVGSLVSFGLFGSHLFALIKLITNKSPFQFIRDACVDSFALFILSIVLVAFRGPVQSRIWQRRRPSPPESSEEPELESDRLR